MFNFISESYELMASRARRFKAEDGSLCRYCLQPFHIDYLTIEHIIPRHLFQGSAHANDNNNLILACITCNSIKGNKLLDDDSLSMYFTPPVRFYKTGILDHYINMEWVSPEFVFLYNSLADLKKVSQDEDSIKSFLVDSGYPNPPEHLPSEFLKFFNLPKSSRCSLRIFDYIPSI